MTDGPARFTRTTSTKHTTNGTMLLLRGRPGKMNSAFGAPVTGSIAGMSPAACLSAMKREKLPVGWEFHSTSMIAKWPRKIWQSPMSDCAWLLKRQTLAPGTTTYKQVKLNGHPELEKFLAYPAMSNRVLNGSSLALIRQTALVLRRSSSGPLIPGFARNMMQTIASPGRTVLLTGCLPGANVTLMEKETQRGPCEPPGWSLISLTASRLSGSAPCLPLRCNTVQTLLALPT